MHHSISDGWSMSVLVREMNTLYRAFLRGEPSPLPELPIQYADYAVWQRQWLQGKILEDQLTYWEAKLLDAPVMNLPFDGEWSKQRYSVGANKAITLPQHLSTR